MHCSFEIQLRHWLSYIWPLQFFYPRQDSVTKIISYPGLHPNSVVPKLLDVKDNFFPSIWYRVTYAGTLVCHLPQDIEVPGSNCDKD